MTIEETEIEKLREMATKANSAGSTAAQMGIERCRLCVAVGDKLRAWKKVVPHGEFGELQKRIGIADNTASKWMRASQAVESGKIKLGDVRGIRQLYVMLGIVPRVPTESKGKVRPAVESHVTLAGRLIESLHALPVSGWTMLQRRTLADVLKPIADFHRKL